MKQALKDFLTGFICGVMIVGPIGVFAYQHVSTKLNLQKLETFYQASKNYLIGFDHGAEWQKTLQVHDELMKRGVE